VEKIQKIVDQYSPAGAQIGVLRLQRRVGILLVEVFVDNARLEQEFAVIVDDRNLAVRIALDMLGIFLLHLAKLDPYPFPGESFFRQDDFDTIAVGGRHVMI